MIGISMEHCIALSFMGIGSMLCFVQSHSTEGMYLLMIMAGYAFKNGVAQRINKK